MAEEERSFWSRMTRLSSASEEIIKLFGLLSILASGGTAAYLYLFEEKSDELSINVSMEVVDSLVVTAEKGGKSGYAGKMNTVLTNQGETDQNITYAEYTIFTISAEALPGALSETGTIQPPIPYSECFGEVMYGWVKVGSYAYGSDDHYEEVLAARQQSEQEVIRGGATVGWLNSGREKLEEWNFSFSESAGGAYLIRYYFETDSHKERSRKFQCQWKGDSLPQQADRE